MNLHFFEWPAGYPLHNALAGTENLSGWQFLYSPLRSLGASVGAAYNTALLASIVISGIGTAAFSRRLGASQFGALVGGFAFAFNPFHVDHMIHLQTMAICWSPFALMGLDMALERSSPIALSLLGVSFVMTMLCGMYFGVFLAMVLVLYPIIVWITRRFTFSFAILRDLTLTAVVCAVVLSPVLVHYFEFARAYGAYPHSGEELALSSVPIVGLIQVPVWLASGGHFFPFRGDVGRFASAFPGLVVFAAVSCALLLAKTRSQREIVGTLMVLGFLCWLLSLGPTVEWRLGDPSRLLTSLPLPGKLWLAVSAIRWPMRIFMYTILCFALLAGLGTTWLMEKISEAPRRFAQVALLSLMYLELRPSGWFAQQSAAVVDPMRMSDAYPFLAGETDRGGVVELPSRIDSGLVTPFAARYAYASAGHLRKVVSFHGSMFPPVADSLRMATYDLPAPDAILMMRSHGVTRLVIHKDLMSRDSSNYLVAAFLHDGDRVVFDGARSTVFSLIR